MQIASETKVTKVYVLTLTESELAVINAGLNRIVSGNDSALFNYPAEFYDAAKIMGSELSRRLSTQFRETKQTAKLDDVMTNTLGKRFPKYNV